MCEWSPHKPQVTETRDKESEGARDEAPVAMHLEELGGEEDAMGEQEELEGPCNQHMEVVLWRCPG